MLAHRALEFFADGRPARSGPGLTALEAISFIVPLNLLLLGYSLEKGFTLVAWGSKLLLLFVEAVFLAVICRPFPAPGSALFHAVFLSGPWLIWTGLPQISLLATVAAASALLARFVRTRHPLDGAFVWASIGAALAFAAGGAGRAATGLFATGCLILTLSILESSYRMAYYDELTGVPGRRAFNEALLQLARPYTVAVVDIDHFKKFNDTYGHDIGDDVLRMVARRLANVSGGGKAFRVGGEEFNILFSGRAAVEVQEYLEKLRKTVELAEFRLRGSDRRAEARGAERRRANGTRKTKSAARGVDAEQMLTVTISIGFSEASDQQPHPAQVIAAADHALYDAKALGRNRVVKFSKNLGVQAKRRKRASATSA